MIRSLHLKNFRNFEDATFHFGPFSVIAGENATGKSNLGDALRILNGIATLLDLDSIFKQIRSPIRSGADTATISATFAAPDGEILQYGVGFCATPSDAVRFRVVHEELRGNGDLIFTRSPSAETLVGKSGKPMAAPVYVRRTNGKFEPMDNRSVSLTALFGSALAADVPEHSLEYILYLWEVFKRIHTFALVPEDLRAPGAKGAEALQETGRDFPSVLKRVCQDPGKSASVVEWLRELTPTDIQALRFVQDPDQRTHLEVEEGNGVRFGAHNVSDGTLRFLAVLTAILGARDYTTCFVDELESGLHPSRVWLLVRLIEEHVGEKDLQLIATTHSPEVLDRINDRTFEHSTVLARVRGRTASSAHRLADLPDAGRLRKARGLGGLLRNGWMEDVLYLQDDSDEKTDSQLEKVVR